MASAVSEAATSLLLSFLSAVELSLFTQQPGEISSSVRGESGCSVFVRVFNLILQTRVFLIIYPAGGALTLRLAT